MTGNGIGIFLSAIQSLIVGEATLIQVTNALTTSMLANPLFALAGGALVGVFLIKAWDEAYESLEDLDTKVKETTESINSLQSEYDSLSQKTDLTGQEQQRLVLLLRRLEKY